MQDKFVLILLFSFIAFILLGAFFLGRGYYSRNTQNTTLDSSHTFVDTCDSELKLIYYSQTFSDELEEIEYQKKISCMEAIEIVEKFYSTGFKKGDIFLIGFDSADGFYELSKNNQGIVSILRVEVGNDVVFDESFNKNIALSQLKQFWNSLELRNKSGSAE